MKDTYRMYGLVPYNLSPIQQGIQFGHAVVEYGLKYFDTKEYKEWANECKTFIILNGGTTNNSEEYKGSLNKHADKIWELEVPSARFHEPDLGNQLTAVVFLVPEQVYNKALYPDFEDYVIKQFSPWYLTENKRDMEHAGCPSIEIWLKDLYLEWTTLVGGPEIVELRNFLKPFRLA